MMHWEGILQEATVRFVQLAMVRAVGLSDCFMRFFTVQCPKINSKMGIRSAACCDRASIMLEQSGPRQKLGSQTLKDLTVPLSNVSCNEA